MSPSSEEDIQIILHRQKTAWNNGDARAYAQDCDEHISFTNILGQVLFGRTGFEEKHAAIFASFFKGSQMEFSVRRIHFPLPEVAIVDLDVEITAYPALPPGIPAPVGGVLRTCLLQVFVYTDETWHVTAYHNVDIK